MEKTDCLKLHMIASRRAKLVGPPYPPSETACQRPSNEHSQKVIIMDGETYVYIEPNKNALVS